MAVQLVPFETEVEELGYRRVRIAAHGELDLATASRLRAALSACLREEPRLLVVDLADVPFMDASGLHVLIDAERQQRAGGRALQIGHASPAVARLLELAAPRLELQSAE